MKITGLNKERYIKRILIKVLRDYFINKWLVNPIFNITKEVNKLEKSRMNQIKQYIYENAYIHENLWYIYREIKDFKKIIDLLYYLSPSIYYKPEVILLGILRGTKRFKIGNGKFSGQYYLYWDKEEKLSHTKKEIIATVKIFVRSYVNVLLDIKREPKNIDDLYLYFIREEISYSLAKEYRIIKILKENHNYNLKDLLLLTSENETKNPKEIFADLIKHDYNRFFRLIDDYFGNKNWDDKLRFKAYLKLYDQYSYNGSTVKAEGLGEILLKSVSEIKLEEPTKSKIKRLILRKVERGKMDGF